MTTVDSNEMNSDDAQREKLLEAVIADYIRTCETGSAADRREIIDNHPELAVELRQFFAQRDRMNRFAEPIRSFADDLFQSIGPGQQISYVGNYELIQEIARGGMGVVYKARQTTLGRIVAVKMIMAGRLASEDDVKRFQVEAQAAASLQHPNIVSIHEVGLHEGWHYFSMDYVSGRNLSAILHENLLPARQAATYVWQMAEAIHYAHQQGTLHRDLKPSNILIDDHDQVRITDFGLAMRVEGGSDLTRTGQIVGTPSYMPPEQAQGKRSLIGPASDVYSLGAILYEALTGRAPFRADSVLKTIEQVIHVEAASPRLLNPGVARDLETICLKCLQKEPHRRYGTAQLLADDLRRYLDGRPILARPVSTAERTWRWCRRKPAVAGLLATVALCLIFGTAISSYFAIEADNRARAEAFQRDRADDKAALAERRRKEADDNANLAEQRSSELTRAMEKLATEEQKTRAALIAETAASNGLEKSNADLRDTIEREQEANYYNNVLLAWREWQAGHVAQAEKHLDRCRADLRSWEWNYMMRLCRSTTSIANLGNVSGVNDVTFGLEPPGICISGDGTRVAYIETGSTVVVLDTRTRMEVLRLGLAEQGVSSVAISHDGERVATLSKANFSVWNTATRQVLMTQSNLSTNFNRLEFSSDASRIIASHLGFRAVSREDGFKRSMLSNVSIISVESGRIMVSGGWGAVENGNVAYSQDGRRGAKFIDTECQISSVPDGRTFALTAFKKKIAAGDFSPDGTRIAIFDIGSNIVVFDTTTGERISGWDLHPERIERIRFSPDGSKIATLSALSVVNVWDVFSGRLIMSLRESAVERSLLGAELGIPGGMGPLSFHRYFAFSPDSTRIASASGDHKVTVWSLANCKETALRTREPIHFVAFNASAEHQLIYATQSQQAPAIGAVPSTTMLQLREWNSLGQSESRLLHTLGLFAHTVSVNRAGTRIASISNPVENGRRDTVAIYDLQSGREEFRVPWERGGRLFDVAFSPDDTMLAVTGERGVAVLDLATKGIRSVVTKATGRCHRAVFLQNGIQILIAHNQGVSIHNAQTGEETATPGQTGVTCAVLNADETTVAAAAGGGSVRIMSAATGRTLIDLSPKNNKKQYKHVYCVAFNRDSTRLAAAGEPGNVTVWDAVSGQQLLELPAHDRRTYTVSFSHDGKRLISMGEDGVLRVWDGNNGREILTLTGHADRVYSATFTHDGSQIVSTSADGTIRIWDGRPILE